MARCATRIPVTDIKQKLYDFLAIKMLKGELCEQQDLDEWSQEDAIIYGFSEYCIKAFNDLCKVNFSLENMTLDPGEPYGDFTVDMAREWLGPQAIGDLTFIGCMGGGDWEDPVAFIIYWDGKTFRGYVPAEGNSYDLASKAAIGSAPEGAVERTFDVTAMKTDVAARISVRN